MSKKETDISNMAIENGMYVDYSELYKGSLNANPKETRVGYKCYDTINHKFVGLVDENKIACWYVSEKSCVKFTAVEVDYTHWYVGNIYAPRNKTKIGKEIVKGFLVVETSVKESVRLMTPTGEIKEVLNPTTMTSETASTACDVVDDSALYISSYNTADKNGNVHPIIGYKIFGRRSKTYKGIINLNGEYINIEENKLKQFDGPCEMALRYV